MRSASRQRIERSLPEWRVRFADDADSWQNRIFDRRLGFELWRPVVLILLLLLLAEAAVAATGSTRGAAVSAQET